MMAMKLILSFCFITLFPFFGSDSPGLFGSEEKKDGTTERGREIIWKDKSFADPRDRYEKNTTHTCNHVR